MTRQDIETAIEYGNGVLQTLEHGESLATLIHVAKAWLELEDYLLRPCARDGEKGSTYLEGKRDAFAIVKNKMQELLNPALKGDMQRIREWANTYRFRSGGLPGLVPYDYLIKKLDQLEAEHKEKP